MVMNGPIFRSFSKSTARSTAELTAGSAAGSAVRRMLRATLAAGGALALACLSGVQPAAAADTDADAGGGAATPFNVFQLNLCNSGLAPCYSEMNSKSQSVREAVTAIKDNELPAVVTLNEICRGDLTTLTRDLGGEYLAGDFVPVLKGKSGQPSDPNNHLECSKDGEGDGTRENVGDFPTDADLDYGVGVLVRKSLGQPQLAASGAYHWRIQYSEEGKDNERRVWGCWRISGDRPFSACTTHLDSKGDKSIREAQYNRFTAHASEADGPTVAAGDLNLSYSGDQDVLNAGVPDGWARKGEDASWPDFGSHVQHVLYSPGFRFTGRANIGMDHTDHSGLLVKLSR